MAVKDVSFAAQVDAWCRKSEQRMEAVFRTSAERVIVEMRTPKAKGGNMPVDTGFLRNSVVVTTDGPTPIREDAKPKPGASYDQTGDDLSGPATLIIAQATIGQKIWACFTAVYAARREYGFVGKDSRGREISESGDGFVRLAAQNWQKIVSGAIRDAKAAVKANTGSDE